MGSGEWDPLKVDSSKLVNGRSESSPGDAANEIRSRSGHIFTWNVHLRGKGKAPMEALDLQHKYSTSNDGLCLDSALVHWATVDSAVGTRGHATSDVLMTPCRPKPTSPSGGEEVEAWSDSQMFQVVW